MSMICSHGWRWLTQWLSNSVNVFVHRSACRSVDVLLFALFECWWALVLRLHRCLLRIGPLASEKRFGHRKTCAASRWNLRQHHSFALLERFEGSWRSRVLLLPGASFSTVIVEKESVQLMASSEPISLSSGDENRSDFWWKYSQDFSFLSWMTMSLTTCPVSARGHLSMHCHYPHTAQFIRHSPPTPSHIPVSVISSLPRCFCLQLFCFKNLSWISDYLSSFLLYY